MVTTSTLPCPVCKRTPQQGCWTVSGHALLKTPHTRQADQTRGWDARDPEVAGLNGLVNNLKGQIQASAGNLAEADAKNASLSQQLATAQAKIAELEAELTPAPVVLYENAAVTRIKLPANSHGGGAGINTPYKLTEVVDEATCSYEAMFDPGFTWHLGGKFPGLLGVVDGTSPTFPTGGKPDPTNLGWSGRLMWLEPAGGTFTGVDGTRRRALSPAEIIGYLYHPGQVDNTGPTQYGDNAWTGYTPPVGDWFTVQTRHVMNTVGKADGILQIWLGGKLLVDRHDFIYRTRPDLHISHFLMVAFPGGNTTAYEAPVDRYVSFRNVKVTTPAA